MKETATESSPSKLSKGLLMVPKNAAILQHRRAGSTGTTGDESYTTDEEDNVEIDEPDLRNPTKLFNHDSSDFGSFSDIATITDKVMHRNSSDSSVYSDLGLDKLEKGEDQPDWARQVVGAKEQTFTRLQDELRDAHEELKLKDEEVARLSRIRQDVEAELEDLTASLFQEAHNMVREANEKQATAEKALKESQMKVDVLTAEVAALKTLVLTSTPSRPNPHLHPQIDGRMKDESKKHRRSPSHFNLKYGRENSPPESPVKEVYHIPCEVENKEGLEVDPNVHREFLAWRQKPCLDKGDPFVHRIYREDIDLCLTFSNEDLSKKVREAVEAGTILIEAVGDKTKAMFPKKCALLEVQRLCFYRMNIGEMDTWYSISQICRNRLIAVCDFLNYLKYIERGLVKSSAHDVYWEIVRLRKEMVLARLGLNLNS
ncbi:guanine nucleotide exchange factor for Rab-3A-like [Tribolium madens]|uniref:guanine nucleotide exchange factor for Rab-3A-like n=1 Tax=Tribolium madens TaxID=41895 RepID=UPI001CF72A7A|nr:guanine nucleotide exchange factor for Rab-3A-like [Tribolium madens]XP_044254845.1 guanine nucleotide exchange factor for Rab-3A-like [Tribolium madens]